MPLRARHRPPAGAGFTILELLLVMAIIAGLAVVLSMGIKRVRATDLRADTTRVIQTLRSAAAMATATGKHHRVVFDLEARSFRIERCEGEVKLHRERREERAEELDESKLEQARRFLEGDATALGGGGFGGALGGATSDLIPEIQAAMSPEEAAEKAKALAGMRVGAGTCQEPTRTRGGKEVPDPRGKVRALIKENRFAEIWVQHLEEPAREEGTVTVNFFPLGYAEKAVIKLVNDDDDAYTVLVHGITGRIELVGDDRFDPEEHMLRDATGKRVEER